MHEWEHIKFILNCYDDGIRSKNFMSKMWLLLTVPDFLSNHGIQLLTNFCKNVFLVGGILCQFADRASIWLSFPLGGTERVPPEDSS